MTQIKIAPTKEEKADKKEFEKQVEFFKSEKTFVADDGHTKVIKSKRNTDHFVGGPMDNMECSHQPNGPTLPFDPGRFWADYYFKDTMTLPGEFRKVSGFHLYSSSRALELAFKHGTRHRNHKGGGLSIGTRGPNMVKLYYYIGFFENGVLEADSINPHTFTGILTLS